MNVHPALPLGLAVLLLLAPVRVRAHDFVVDPSCTPTLWSMYSNRLLGPLSQSFVPALPARKSSWGAIKRQYR